MKHFIIATAGHVDHGKSALVKALTGTDPDRLPEEKARQITIDLGFAELNLREPDGEQIHAAIVDVPGHEDFVKNMIAGVGSIDLALFVVAADDGWMPQTEEHLQILTHLNVMRAVVALTKSDLADATKTAAVVRDQLKQTPFENAPIVATSTITGFGLEELKRVIALEFSSVAPQADLGKPRLFVDRAFSLRGVGTVVTGTLTGGILMREQQVVVQPGNIRTRIRMIQSHNREQQQVGPGMRVALNLSDMTAGKKTGGVERGNVITIPELGEPVTVFDAALTRSPRSIAKPGKIKNNSSVYLHHGTTRLPARITIAPRINDEGDPFDCRSGPVLAQITVEAPVFALVGDRFVLRDPSERRTLTGGVVLDVETNRKKFRDANQREFLTARAKSPRDVATVLRSELHRDGAREHADLLLRSHFSAEEVRRAIQDLVASEELALHDDVVVAVSWWSKFRRSAVDAIDAQHRESPQLAGLDLAQLRADLGIFPLKIFDALIADLCGNGYMKAGNLIKRSAHHVVLSPELTEAAGNIRRLVSEKPFDPPARKQIAPDARTRQMLSLLIDEKEIIDVGPDLVLSKKAFTEMKRAVTDFIAKNGPATVSELRQMLQTSRRTVVPFLERLDRERITRRLGDQRTLVEKL
jgi:selenocysteine-specific elongation factor